MSAKQLFLYNRSKHGDIHRKIKDNKPKQNDGEFQTIDVNKNRFFTTNEVGVVVQKIHAEARFFVIGALTLLSTFLLKDSVQALLKIYIYPLKECNVNPEKAERSRRSRWIMLLVSLFVAGVSILVITLWPEPDSEPSHANSFSA